MSIASVLIKKKVCFNNDLVLLLLAKPQSPTIADNTAKKKLISNLKSSAIYLLHNVIRMPQVLAENN